VEAGNRIGIDTGAYYSEKLTALVLEGAERRYLDTSA
ncbi:MAG: serine/threonine protein phosphatase, partial [Parasphingorhabdus sp.]